MRTAALLVSLLAINLFTMPRWADWNQNSRLDQILAIVDDGELQIDKYRSNTGDYAYFEGHYYSDKAPGVALLGSPIYALLKVAGASWFKQHAGVIFGVAGAYSNTQRADEGGIDLAEIWFFVSLVALAVVLGAIPAAVLGVLLYRSGLTYGCGPRSSIAVAALYCLGTCAFAYSNSLYSHQLSALLVFAAYFMSHRARTRIEQGASVSSQPYIGVGFLLGTAVLTEYPTAILGAVITAYCLLSGCRMRTLVALGVGAVIPIAVLVEFDWVVFHDIAPVGYRYSALFPQAMQTGFFSISGLRWDAIWGISFSPYRGMFFISPYLLFAIPAYVWWRRWVARRADLLVLGGAPAAFFLFNASSALWDGGFAVGPRYFIPALPFLALVAGKGVTLIWERRQWRPVVVTVVAWSLAVVWAESLGGQAFPDYSQNPLWEFSLPRLAHGDVARNVGMLVGLRGWMSLIPIALITGAGGLALFLPRAVAGALLHRPAPTSYSRADLLAR